MKKQFVLLVMVMSIFVSTSAVFAQKSTMYVGDKSNAKIERSVEIYKGVINDLKERKSDLEISLKNMLKKPGENEFAITKTDSMINVCQEKIMAMDDKLIEFTDRSAGKDQLNIINLKSRNLSAMAEAMLAANYINSNKSESNASVASADSARIENNWYRQVYVKIQGPGRWHTAFTLGSGKYLVLPLSMPGRYVVSYTSGNTTKCVGKVFDTMNSDVDSKTGRKYAFLSEMPAR